MSTATNTHTTTAADLLAQAAPLLARLGKMWFRPGAADSPEDLAQDIAARALARLDRYDPRRFRGGFECWLRLVARTVALNARWERHSASRRPTFARQAPELGGRSVLELVPDHRDADAPDPREEEEREARRRRRLGRVGVATLRLSTRQRVAVTRRYGLGAVEARSFRAIDPARSEKSNREAVARGVENLRRLLAGGD
jgi:DNA-directed RNA polymerase specialized sigma24 family protein